jgi:ketosteroid isomerase-like protein
MTDQDQISVRSACADLISKFAYHVDHREFDKAVSLFADDGVFERPDNKSSGRSEIAKIWEGRPISVVTVHICAAPAFIEVSNDRAKSVTYCTLYHLEHEGEGFPKSAGSTAITEFHDEFRLTPDGWRISHRRGVPVLLGG